MGPLVVMGGSLVDKAHAKVLYVICRVDAGRGPRAAAPHARAALVGGLLVVVDIDTDMQRKATEHTGPEGDKMMSSGSAAQWQGSASVSSHARIMICHCGSPVGWDLH